MVLLGSSSRCLISCGQVLVVLVYHGVVFGFCWCLFGSVGFCLFSVGFCLFLCCLFGSVRFLFVSVFCWWVLLVSICFCWVLLVSVGFCWISVVFFLEFSRFLFVSVCF